MSLLLTDAQPRSIAKDHRQHAAEEPFAIEYLDRRWRPYWVRSGRSVQTMLLEAMQGYTSAVAKSDAVDEQLTARLLQDGGPVYARLATLAFRQTLAANGLVSDVDSSPLQFPKKTSRMAASRPSTCSISPRRSFCTSTLLC